MKKNYKRYITGAMAVVMATSTLGASASTVFAAEPSSIIDSQNNNEISEFINVSLNIEKYLSISSDGYFVLNKDLMEKDGISTQTIATVISMYGEVNASLSTIEKEQLKNNTNSSPEERGKLTAAVKVLKKFLKEQWPKIYEKLPKIVQGYLTLDFLIEMIDAYVAVSDTIEELLTNAINAILPSSLEFLTPGIVTIITTLLPI